MASVEFSKEQTEGERQSVNLTVRQFTLLIKFEQGEMPGVAGAQGNLVKPEDLQRAEHVASFSIFVGQDCSALVLKFALRLRRARQNIPPPTLSKRGRAPTVRGTPP